jgi:hypothetical protein
MRKTRKKLEKKCPSSKKDTPQLSTSSTQPEKDAKEEVSCLPAASPDNEEAVSRTLTADSFKR